jgi:molybdenum cofactor cytidylyltransferase
MSEVAVVILAAGMSTRLGRPKQTLPLAGKPLVAHAARRARASKAERCLAVIGPERELVEASLERIIDELVVNDNYAAGQGTSISAAIKYLIGTDDLFGACDAAVFVLGDEPGIETKVIDQVIDAWNHGAGIVMTQYADRAGHPVLFDRQYWSELAALHGDQGGRTVLARHPSAVAYVTVDGPGPMDVDTDFDWRRLQEIWPGK